MTDPEIERAEAQTRESRRRAERELQQARQESAQNRTLAQRLRALREHNGFEGLFNEAFGRAHGPG